MICKIISNMPDAKLIYLVCSTQSLSLLNPVFLFFPNTLINHDLNLCYVFLISLFLVYLSCKNHDSRKLFYFVHFCDPPVGIMPGTY